MKSTKSSKFLRDLRKSGLLNRIPDALYLKLIYRSRMHQRLRLKNPQTFNEKLQWLKLYDRKPEYTAMVDKIEAKKYAASIIGEAYIVPTLGVWERFDDIDFDALPDRFVLKCSHDSGGLVICRDKSTLDKLDAKQKIDGSMADNYYWRGREWPYKNVKPRILAETFLSAPEPEGIIDYKFFCFDGEPKFLYISHGLEDHATAEISFYDLEKREMPFHRADFKPYHNAFFPDNFEQMKELAAKLAQSTGAPFVRIDLYSIDQNIYFSEITFSPCGGFVPFEPKEWDEKLGSYITLPKK